MSETPSAPPASTAFAISVISVTFGESFMITGCAATFFTSLVILSAIDGFCPNAIPPSFTFGQDIFISSMSTAFDTSSIASLFTTFMYSSSECPHTFTITLAPLAFKNARSLSINVSIPGFCNPIALSIPAPVSAILGVGLPFHGLSATPFVVTAPSLSISTNSLYSIPEPNVPEAVVIGFSNSIPAKLTLNFLLMPSSISDLF